MSAQSVLVGRRAERERLSDAVRRARVGSGSLVLLTGEAGVGKSRLAGELAQDARGRILFGRRAMAPRFLTVRSSRPFGPTCA